MTLTLITAPAASPVSLVEAKAHLRVVDDDEDDLIGVFINAATAHAEKFLGRALVDQTWDYILDEFPDDDGSIEIPLPPLIEVVGVFYTDSAGDEQEMTGADYVVSGAGGRGNHPARIFLPTGSWPTPRDTMGAIRVRFRSGYLDTSSPPAADIDEDIRAAILLIIGSLYAHRETVVVGQVATMVPWSAERLLRMKRVDLSLA